MKASLSIFRLAASFAILAATFSFFTPLNAHHESTPHTHPQNIAPVQNNKGTQQAKPRLSNYQLLGIDAAKQRLGRKMPTGKNIIFGHVEGPAKSYIPNTKLLRFSKVNFNKRSGPSSVAGHATTTASKIYGSSGLAPGVTNVNLFSANSWMGPDFLGLGTGKPPKNEEINIFTNSWIGAEFPGATQLLRRIDYMIDNNGAIVVAGVNNGRNTQVPPLVASSYNGIAVGTWGGEGSSGNYTTIETTGRVKPDIVGIYDKTSFTTPLVAATASLILELAQTRELPQLARPETVKAIILAGATKPWNWKPEPGHTQDKYLGAGILNLNNALLIAEAPQTHTSNPLPDFGWDYASISPTQTHTYNFTIPNNTTKPLTVCLVWNRHILGKSYKLTINKEKNITRDIWVDTPSIADLDLRLLKVNPDNTTRIVTLSDSERDNVEYLYLPKLTSGNYQLQVVRQPDKLKPQAPWPYAIAYRFGGDTWQGDN
ncbi:hypothetical protein KS4_02810 [Poriferisphaera corsica]|uniref:Peptidase S8/S53 domain-containing protein n=1 Tax=Poriferisphaera corsica TaxID=2528020 RepID=A0A517YPW1_9BACT|nr:hypothetical protein [Poriferisphaera corsica]QDU32250.1 hypothetical protein KS4_02810 [Poriferisphaera corsica]